jgi:hypothetical protein
MKVYERKLHIEKNTLDLDSCRAIRKSLNSTERQRGKKELSEMINDDMDFTFHHRYGDCSCYSCQDNYLDYLPFVDSSTIGGRFLTTLVKLDLMKSWKKDSSMSDLYYSVAVSPKGLIASIYVRPDTASDLRP